MTEERQREGGKEKERKRVPKCFLVEENYSLRQLFTNKGFSILNALTITINYLFRRASCRRLTRVRQCWKVRSSFDQVSDKSLARIKGFLSKSIRLCKTFSIKYRAALSTVVYLFPPLYGALGGKIMYFYDLSSI